MKIMSFNILCGGAGDRDWHPRTDYVTGLIRRYEPDTFGVQEAHIEWMQVLTAALPMYQYVGVGRDDGKQEGEFSAVFFKKDKFTLLDSGSFWLSEHPDRPGLGWDAACIRICSWAKLKNKTTGNEFVHFNTHLDHRGEIAMQKGAELVTLKAKEIYPDGVCFFTGDFNVTPDSAPYRAVIDGGFEDSRLLAQITDNGSTFHTNTFVTDKPTATDCIIDYCFKKGNMKILSYRVLRDVFDGNHYASDHHPILVEAEF